jgi:hypothetical protein
MSEPLVIIDLDRTLFETDRFFDDFCRCLEEHFHVDVGKIQAEYRDFYEHGENDLRHYDFFRHLATIGLKASDNEVEERLIEALSSNGYLYDDAEPFLDFLKPHNLEVLILTYGEERFQRLKYRCVPALGGYAFTSTLRPKPEYIANNFVGRVGVIVDDQSIPDVPEGFQSVWLQRGHRGEDVYSSLDDVRSHWGKLIVTA